MHVATWAIIIAVIVIVIAGIIYYLRQNSTTTETADISSVQAAEGLKTEIDTVVGEDTKSVTSPAEETAQTYNVEIRSFEFRPATLQIRRGDKVVWTNRDFVHHSVISDEGGELMSRMLMRGESYPHVFTAVGTYYYHCGSHPNMKGTVIVQ